MKSARSALLLGILAPTLAAAQSSGANGLAASCAALPAEFSADSRDFCYTVAQAAEAVQPQLGIVLVGGNVTPGSASSGGMHLGVIPGFSATAKVNFAMAHFPDVSDANAGAGSVTGEKSLPAPAIQGTAAVGVIPGFSVAPGLGGIGAIDALGSVSWLPTGAIRGFGENSAATSYGIGGRLGILKESFVAPGVSVSLMYHSLGQVSYGNVCDSAAVPTGSSGSKPHTETAICAGGGDPGEFAFDLNDWSARAQVSKKLVLVGLAAGVGYDRWSSDTDFGFRGSCFGSSACYLRVTDAELDTSRWSAFADATVGGLFGSLVAEVGWLQGSNPISGFNSAVNEFDPKGTFFGSVGLKLAL